MRRCPKCGFPLNEKDKYCENCGEDCSAVEDSEVNEVVSPDEEKEKLKKQWKIGGIVFGVVALVFAAILALVLFVPHSSSSSNTKTKSSLTEPTTVDNSIDGKGYYYFDNKFNEETVDKFMSAFDDEGSMGDLGIGVELSDFKYQEDCTIFGKKVSQYMQVDFNGKTGTFLYLDDENNVVAYSLTFVYSLLNDVTTDDVYKVKQTVGRLASWLYALSDYKSYDSCEKVAKHFISEILDEDNDGIPCFYYDGYTMLCNGDTNQIVLNFLVTDPDFIEKHGIAKGTPSIFQAVTEPSTTIQNTTEPESIDDGSSDADDDYILPDSGTRKLTNSDLAGLDADELELARNEIYARAGRRFNTDYIQDYFDDKWWYVGTIEPEDFTEDMLNDVEKYNVNFIRNYEKKYVE